MGRSLIYEQLNTAKLDLQIYSVEFCFFKDSMRPLVTLLVEVKLFHGIAREAFQSIVWEIVMLQSLFG